MKNIIFIGPYRQYDYPGIESGIYLRALSAKINNRYNLYTRPIFLNKSHEQQLSQNIYGLYENIPESFDGCYTMIQHCPPAYMSVYKKWFNVCIPMLEPMIHQLSIYNQTVTKLNQFDAIIVATEEEKNILTRSQITRPIHIVHENISSYADNNMLNQRYDFGIIGNSLYNFGYIGQFSSDNISIIEKIIIAFFIGFRNDNTKRLNLFLRGTEQDKYAIDKLIHNIQQRLSIVIRPNLNIYFSNLDLPSCIAALNSIDCFISMNMEYKQPMFEHYIKQINKSLISLANIDYNIEPRLSLNLNEDAEDRMCDVSINTLISKLQNATHNKNNFKSNKYPNLGNLICEILK